MIVWIFLGIGKTTQQRKVALKQNYKGGHGRWRVVAALWRRGRGGIPACQNHSWEAVSSIGPPLAQQLLIRTGRQGTEKTLSCGRFYRANVNLRIVSVLLGCSSVSRGGSEPAFASLRWCSAVEIAKKMSSPSPGKRRMDTDVVKLYPFWALTTSQCLSGSTKPCMSCVCCVVWYELIHCVCRRRLFCLDSPEKMGLSLWMTGVFV